jgi:hypothetical protein
MEGSKNLLSYHQRKQKKNKELFSSILTGKSKFAKKSHRKALTTSKSTAAASATTAATSATATTAEATTAATSATATSETATTTAEATTAEATTAEATTAEATTAEAAAEESLTPQTIVISSPSPSQITVATSRRKRRKTTSGIEEIESDGNISKNFEIF